MSSVAPFTPFVQGPHYHIVKDRTTHRIGCFLLMPSSSPSLPGSSSTNIYTNWCPHPFWPASWTLWRCYKATDSIHCKPHHITPRHATPRHMTPHCMTPRHATQTHRFCWGGSSLTHISHHISPKIQRNNQFQTLQPLKHGTVRFITQPYPPHVCIRYGLVQATAGVRTVISWDLI